jgi:hypothetical protein
LFDGLQEQVATNEIVFTPTQPGIDLPLVRKVTLPSTLDVAVRVNASLEVVVLTLPATDNERVVLALKLRAPFFRSKTSSAERALV